MIAHEKDYFKIYGLNAAISREASWANIRDKISIGALDGAHMLAGMPIAATWRVGATPMDTITAFSKDIRLIVILPRQIVANLQSKNIAGYCVGQRGTSARWKWKWASPGRWPCSRICS